MWCGGAVRVRRSVGVVVRVREGTVECRCGEAGSESTVGQDSEGAQRGVVVVWRGMEGRLECLRGAVGD